MSLLELREVAVHFGGLHALDGLSFAVEEGEVLGLIGPNGSGKSTAFNVVTGVVEATAGNVVFDGEDITGQSPHKVAYRGIGRTFQLVRPFPRMTALENVLVGTYFGAGRIRGSRQGPRSRTRGAGAHRPRAEGRCPRCRAHHPRAQVAGGGACAGGQAQDHPA